MSLAIRIGLGLKIPCKYFQRTCFFSRVGWQQVHVCTHAYICSSPYLQVPLPLSRASIANVLNFSRKIFPVLQHSCILYVPRSVNLRLYTSAELGTIWVQKVHLHNQRAMRVSLCNAQTIWHTFRYSTKKVVFCVKTQSHQSGHTFSVFTNLRLCRTELINSNRQCICVFRVLHSDFAPMGWKIKCWKVFKYYGSLILTIELCDYQHCSCEAK